MKPNKLQLTIAKFDPLTATRMEIERFVIFVNFFLTKRTKAVSGDRIPLGPSADSIRVGINADRKLVFFRPITTLMTPAVTPQSLRKEELEAAHANLWDAVVVLTHGLDFEQFAREYAKDQDPMSAEEFMEALRPLRFGDAVRYRYRQAYTRDSEATPVHVYFLGVQNGVMLCVSKNYFDTFARGYSDASTMRGTGLIRQASVEAMGDVRDLRKDGEIPSEWRQQLAFYAAKHGITVA